jgi:hypothetical protein
MNWVQFSNQMVFTSVQLDLLSSKYFFSKHSVPNLQPLSYATPGETKLEVLLTAGSCCTGFFRLHICYFHLLFLQTNLH